VKRPPTRHDARHLVVLTGLSGSGKSTVLKSFEDMGFYCVDNLPVELMPIFAELHGAGDGDFARAALMIDAREGLQLQKLPPLLKHLRKDHPITLVFIEAHDDALLRRYSETRRPHPLGKDYSVRESLRHERVLMAPIRKLADVVIDTTQFNVHELRQFVTQRFKNPDKRPLMVSVVSFGYRYGVPTDADLVFDVRFLPNPHFVPALRRRTGRDRVVAAFQAQPSKLQKHRTRRCVDEVVSQRNLDDWTRAFRNGDEPWRIVALELVQPHPVDRHHLVGRWMRIESSAAPDHHRGDDVAGPRRVVVEQAQHG